MRVGGVVCFGDIETAFSLPSSVQTINTGFGGWDGEVRAHYGIAGRAPHALGVGARRVWDNAPVL